MSDSFCTVPSVWRHICPKVSDLNVNVDLTKPYTDIEIPRTLRVQGAIPPSDLMLDIFKLQGSFQLEWVVVQEPTKGQLSLSGKGWRYYPHLPNDGDPDVVKYQLSLNSQLSAEATIVLNFH